VGELAIVGGTPVIENPLEWSAVWPPRDEATAERLRELYFSGRWTAFDEPEADFARDFARHHDSRHGVFTINGTATLHIALAACGVGPGDEVIVPPLTWYATAMAVLYVGARPVFVDIRPDTLCLDAEAFEAAITPRTRAVIPVHTYGAFADMESIGRIAARHGIRVIEDCAHMHGGVWDGRKAGSIGDIGSFSFQHSKTMASAEGGICVTNDDELFERMFRIKQIGYGPGELPRQKKTGPPADLFCYNFRVTAFPAVILREQLRTLDERLVRYDRGARYLEERLTASTNVRFQARDPKTDVQGYFEWISLFDHPDFAGIPITLIRDAMQAEGLRIWVLDGPMYDFVLFNVSRDAYDIPRRCTVTEAISATALGLHHVQLGRPESELDQVAEVFEKVTSNLDELRVLSG
jgi:L-glutamine:2-deoxy-scyllo-inosose/3-amino-2,3-dideoxy-scyllo-inosose aminotransferase